MAVEGNVLCWGPRELPSEDWSRMNSRMECLPAGWLALVYNIIVLADGVQRAKCQHVASACAVCLTDSWDTSGVRSQDGSVEHVPGEAD